MIGWLKGTLRAKRPPLLLLDVNGVGYELEAPMTTFYALPELGAEVVLFAHQVVREDAQNLYGFHQQPERDLFRMLLRVSGVGAKMALAILSGMDAAAFTRCIREADTSSLTRLPGIGNKTAERLVIEMRDRLDQARGGPQVEAGAGAETGAIADPVAEAVDALVSLGFKPQEASRRVHGVAGHGLACEQIVRLALQASG